jgi:hypothetical protein
MHCFEKYKKMDYLEMFGEIADMLGTYEIEYEGKCILSSTNTSRREHADSRQTVIAGMRNLFANARRKSIANMPT